MGYFIVILAVATLASGIMLFLLMQIMNLEYYATAWIYGLLRIGLVLLTIPLFVLVTMYMAYLARPVAIPITSDQPDFIAFYEVPYGMLRGSPLQKLYMGLIIAVWLLGILIKTVVAVVRVLRFDRTVLRKSTLVTDPAMLQLVKEIREELGIRRKVPVYCHPAVQVPALVILGGPRILMGSREVSQEELSWIIRHELMHLKRKHILFKRLGVLAQTLYWFNPLIHSFVQFFSDYCELDCDREVLKGRTRVQRHGYAKLLMDLLSKDIPANPAIESAFCGRTEHKTIDRRFKNIMHKPEKKIRVGMLALSLCYVLSCPFVAFGATKAGAEIATDYMRKTKEAGNIKSQFSEKYILATERIRTVEASLEVSDRGTSSISRTISANKRITVSVTAASSTVRIALGSDSASDSFSIAFDGYGADSSNGMISSSFDTEPNKTYKLYIDNNMDHSIHITGTIQN